MTGKVRNVVHPVIDFGGTHCRVGWVSRKVEKGRFSGTPTLLSSDRFACPLNKIGEPDVAKTLAMAKTMIFTSTPEGAKILRTVGGSFPGAWLESGYAYKGTPNNTRELEDYQLPVELGKLMGQGWKAYVNNDGVSHVLAIAQGLIADQTSFPRITETLGQAGNIVGFIPGTGFGAGAFKFRDGQLAPIRGPQQFFDIVIWDGAGILDPHRVNIEDVASGVGLSFQAKHGLLGKRYPASSLSTQAVGKLLSHLAFSGSDSIKADERDFALSLYRQAAKGLAETMKLTYSGGIHGDGRKLVVNEPQELVTQFWNDLRGTKVFILGGWLTAPEVKSFMQKEMWTAMLKVNMGKMPIIFADDIPGVKSMLDNDSVALIGAALLVPDAENLGS